MSTKVTLLQAHTIITNGLWNLEAYLSLQPEALSEQEAGTLTQQGSSLPQGSVPLTLGSLAHSLLINIFFLLLSQ